MKTAAELESEEPEAGTEADPTEWQEQNPQQMQEWWQQPHRDDDDEMQVAALDEVGSTSEQDD